MKFVLFLGFLLKFSLGQDLYPVISIRDGNILGQRYPTVMEPIMQYVGFYGIPYAAPPVGNLRFQPPQPVIPWQGNLSCIVGGNYCHQYIDNRVVGDEDCLYLNVQTPKLPSEGIELMPVMVWIRDGSGAGSMWGPDFLITHNIVLVSFNYRFGLFGFLSTGDAAAYGNMGFKDQVFALEWVRDNAIYFNGDASRVTIFGESSAHFLQLSPLAKGLFHQVIVLNNCALNPWNLQKNMKPYVDNLAAYFNISLTSSTDIVSGLQLINFANLTEIAFNLSSLISDFPTSPPAFAPIIEVDHPGAFITKSVVEILFSGNYTHVPFLFGYLNKADTIALNNVSLPELDLLPEMLVSVSMNQPDNYTVVADLIKNFYLGASTMAENVEIVMRMLTQEFFTFGIRQAIEFQRQFDEGFFYRFTYVGKNVSEYYHDIFPYTNDTPFYWWIPTIEYTKFADSDLAMINKITTIYTNFATYGTPAPVGDPVLGNLTWPKVTASNVGFVDIADELIPGNAPNQTEYDFWSFLFVTYGKSPFQTY